MATINRLSEALGGGVDGVSSAATNGHRDKWVGKEAPGRNWVHPDAMLMQIGVSMD